MKILASLRLCASALNKWFHFKRVCAWCQPHRYIGGNPFAKQVTHTICPTCLAHERALLSFRAVHSLRRRLLLSISLKLRSNNNN